MDQKQTIGAIIKHYRKLKGISQQELARAVGLETYRQIQKAENQDRIEARRLFAIAEALGVPLSEFLGTGVKELEGLTNIAAELGDDERQIIKSYREMKMKGSYGLRLGSTGRWHAAVATMPDEVERIALDAASNELIKDTLETFRKIDCDLFPHFGPMFNRHADTEKFGHNADVLLAQLDQNLNLLRLVVASYDYVAELTEEVLANGLPQQILMQEAVVSSIGNGPLSQVAVLLWSNSLGLVRNIRDLAPDSRFVDAGQAELWRGLSSTLFEIGFYWRKYLGVVARLRKS